MEETERREGWRLLMRDTDEAGLEDAAEPESDEQKQRACTVPGFNAGGKKTKRSHLQKGARSAVRWKQTNGRKKNPQNSE